MDWWFKLAMSIGLPTLVILAIAAFAPLPHRKRRTWDGKGNGNE